MRLKILQAGEPVLRETARPLSQPEIVSEEIQRLIRDMRETMHDAPGVGLAAPQVGLALQLAVIEDREAYFKDVSPLQLAERERRVVPFQVIINPTNHFAGRRPSQIFRGLPQLGRILRSGRPGSLGSGGILERARGGAITGSFRLVCADSAARDRSPAGHALHRPHGVSHVYFDRKLETFLEGQADCGESGG